MSRHRHLAGAAPVEPVALGERGVHQPAERRHAVGDLRRVERDEAEPQRAGVGARGVEGRTRALPNATIVDRTVQERRISSAF